MTSSVHRSLDDRTRIAKGICPSCRYDLSGLASAGKCPECGEVYSIKPEYWPDPKADVTIICREAGSPLPVVTIAAACIFLGFTGIEWIGKAGLMLSLVAGVWLLFKAPVVFFSIPNRYIPPASRSMNPLKNVRRLGPAPTLIAMLDLIVLAAIVVLWVFVWWTFPILR